VATNRRDALKRGFALLGGAIGIGAAGKGGTAAQERTPGIEQSKQLIFHARRLRIGSHDLRRGELPQAGIRMLAYADIVAGLSNDEKVGDFFATYYRVSNPGKVASHEPGSLEQHTFVLPAGTIFGSGVGSSGADSDGQFAITGGTGRYVGARGSYQARQSHLDLGGNGTATFTLTLI
jgi:hypothetical protein